MRIIPPFDTESLRGNTVLTIQKAKMTVAKEIAVGHYNISQIIQAFLRLLESFRLVSVAVHHCPASTPESPIIWTGLNQSYGQKIFQTYELKTPDSFKIFIDNT